MVLHLDSFKTKTLLTSDSRQSLVQDTAYSMHCAIIKLICANLIDIQKEKQLLAFAALNKRHYID